LDNQGSGKERPVKQTEAIAANYTSIPDVLTKNDVVTNKNACFSVEIMTK
jgi:hypothetical protein